MFTETQSSSSSRSSRDGASIAPGALRKYLAKKQLFVMSVKEATLKYNDQFVQSDPQILTEPERTQWAQIMEELQAQGDGIFDFIKTKHEELTQGNLKSALAKVVESFSGIKVTLDEIDLHTPPGTPPHLDLSNYPVGPDSPLPARTATRRLFSTSSVDSDLEAFAAELRKSFRASQPGAVDRPLRFSLGKYSYLAIGTAVGLTAFYLYDRFIREPAVVDVLSPADMSGTTINYINIVNIVNIGDEQIARVMEQVVRRLGNAPENFQQGDVVVDPNAMQGYMQQLGGAIQQVVNGFNHQPG